LVERVPEVEEDVADFVGEIGAGKARGFVVSVAPAAT